MKVVIIGGVAAGVTAAARLRRLDEAAEIILLERGKFISYSACGLPYYLGKVIPEGGRLVTLSPEELRERYRVDVRTENEAVSIDRTNKTVTVIGPDGEYILYYDKLLIGTGSSPVEPDLPGSDSERVVRLWGIPDANRIDSFIERGANRAVIIGAGFIGVESAENLRLRGIEVTLIEKSPQVMPVLDPEMSVAVATELERLGVSLSLNTGVKRFNPQGDALEIELDNGKRIEADFAVLCVGMTPNSGLARAAGLEIGRRGHIVVSRTLQTSDPDIFAAGDVIELDHPLAEGKSAIPLAAPANRQGRAAAGNMLGGQTHVKGTFGASIMKIGRRTAAAIGMTEKELRRRELDYRKLYMHAPNHASFYPDSELISIKLLFSPFGLLLGAQLTGGAGVDKRLDVIGSAMQSLSTAPELADLELGYAPPFNASKDMVNLAGMNAADIMDGLTHPVYPDAIPDDALLVDVREPEEFAAGAIPGALNIPLPQLRERLDEIRQLWKSRCGGQLPEDGTCECGPNCRCREQKGIERTAGNAPGEWSAREPGGIVVYCRVGKRSYIAERILRQQGLPARNLSGGYLTWRSFHWQPKN